MTDPASVLVIRMAYGGYESSGLAQWLTSAALYLHTHPGVKRFATESLNASPVARARNVAVRTAQTWGADLLVLVDHDITPHKDWLPSVLGHFFKCRQRGIPAVWVAPAICDDGKANVALWSQPPNIPFEYSGPLSLERLGATEAARLRGFQEVAAAGCGAIAIDMNVFHRLTPPYFYLEYQDETETVLSTGEDIAFTRDAAGQGIPVYCLWDCWARHQKEVVLEQPRTLHPHSIPSKLRELWEEQVGVQS